MGKVRVAINGLGRIGRLVLREAMDQSFLEVVAVNDVSDGAVLAHLLQYDTIHRTYEKEVAYKEGELKIAQHVIPFYHEKEPKKLPWKALEVDVVIESTGKFTDRESAFQHIKAGAKKVIISAPAKDEDVTIVMGVNEETYDPTKHMILSNASCTTNCLAPFLKKVHETFSICRGLMTTVHSYTNDQRVLDFPHKDLRRARAAAENIIPTTTGAAKAVGKVLPELKGKLTGLAIRVPTANVSLSDIVVEVEKETTVEEINHLFQTASEGELKGILGYSERPLVSSDYIGTKESATIDALSTMVMDGNMIKIVAWYDNEIGYSNRLLDLVDYLGQKGI
ncbi:type I glyceraldehyde-3-phosphate dehydrogenase [Massilibacterium senegalense]|uniref:type I glyceraldehyde-3-phosphate dehydrogenase n=1 Tax=Massilibacterium senegalense TaxID=1632858 RepID=UPI000781F6F1|nr:type I glyceraldehyde-3-phosphate dehydrogenase [Massilibacterium senegalense]